MERNSPSGGKNYVSNNHRDLIPRLHDKSPANNKAHLANDIKSLPPRINPQAFTAQDISNSSSADSTQASASEPVLHLRGGGGVASVIAPDAPPEDHERPPWILWWLAGGMGRPPTFGELRRARCIGSDRADGGSYEDYTPSGNPPPYVPVKSKGKGFRRTIGYILTCGRGFKKQKQEEPESQPSGELVPAFYPPSHP